MRYYIDGYNVTKRDPATRDLPIEEQRSQLEGRMRVQAVKLLGGSSYVIVWDAAGGQGVVHGHGPDVRYTRKPTADDAIVARVRAANARVGVVTSDRGLADRCRAVALHGVDVLPAERLFAGAKPARSAKKRKPLPRDMGIPSNANEINRELKELWGIED